MNNDRSSEGPVKEPCESTEFESHDKTNQVPSTANISNLLSEWLGSHSSLIKRMSKLVLADARLAAVSGLQLAALAIAFALTFGLFLVVCAVALVILLMWLGVSLGASVLCILILHIAILLALFFAIRSTYEGLRFKATRESVFGNTEESEATTNHDQESNNEQSNQ